MTGSEDVFMECPYCQKEILKSASERALMEWLDYHINLQKCMGDKL